VAFVAVLTYFFIFVVPLSGCGGLRLETTTEKRVIIAVPPEMQSDANSGQPAISADGHLVAFMSDATNLVISPTNGAHNIFVKDTGTGVTTRVSTDSNGLSGNKDSDYPAISADGRFVAFESLASNLVPGDTNNMCTAASGTNINCPDVFLKDTRTGETKRISTDAAGEQGDRESKHPSVSADGRFVAFNSGASNIVPGDPNGVSDIFVKDTRTGAITQVSIGAGGERGDDDSDYPAVSADGRFIAFMSDASNLVADDSNDRTDVFLKDMQTGALVRVSSDASAGQGDETSGFGSLAISKDGRFVAFDSGATNLVPGDENGKRDIFLKDTQTGAVSLVSTDAAGAQGTEDSYKSVSLSADGRLVSFSSDAPNLVPGDTNTTSGKSDIFVKDTQTGAITRISTNTAGAQSNGKSELAAISADGLFVAFTSDAGNLIPDDTNRKADIFLKNIKSGATTRISTSTAETMDKAETNTVGPYN